MKYYLMLIFFIFPFLLFAEYKEIIDYKNGYKAVLIKNTKGQITQKNIKDENENILFSENLKYDLDGNLLEIKDHFYKNNKLKTQTTHFSYNSKNKITSIIRGFQSKNERITTFEYDEDGDLILRINPDSVKIHYIYDPNENLIIKSSDNTIHYVISYDNQGSFIKAEDKINNQTIERQVNEFENITKEIFLNDEEIEICYNKKNNPKIIKGKKIGEIQYEYDDFDNLLKVKRVSDFGKDYSHTYLYDKNNEDVIEENLIASLGQIYYDNNEKEQSITISSPYSFEKCFFDSFGNITHRKIDDKEFYYEYDNLFRLIHSDNYDFLYNPINAKVNNLNELLEYNGNYCKYDLNGNLIELNTKENLNYYFKYDALGRLIQAETKNLKAIFTYCPLGRRLSKTIYQNDKKILKETYLYFESNEIASFENGKLKDLRIPGRSFHKDIVKEVAIEIDKNIYCPIHDIQGNILKLINIKTKDIFNIGSIDPFGENLKKIFKNKYSPWLFSSKHYDEETNLVYFGHRYYSPFLKRWITPDSYWIINGINLYAYVMNNPFKYIDPNGKFAFALPFIGKALVDAVAAGIGLWLAYDTAKKMKKDKKESKDKYKKPKPRISGKEGAKNAPDWAKGNRPYKNESGKDFAKRLLDEKYGKGNYRKGPDSEFNKIKKWGDRAWE